MGIISTLIIYIIGVISGFFIKTGFDYYKNFITKQEKSIETMNLTIAKWELINEQKSIKS